MIGILILTLLALILSLILVSIDTKINRKQQKIMSLLPGYNCGACGFNSCEGMCEAILEKKGNYKKCKLLKDESLKELENYIEKMK